MQRARLQEFGFDSIAQQKQTSTVIRLFRELTHFFAIILWVAAGLAFWAGWNDPESGMRTLGWAIIGVIVVNAAFSFAQVYRAERAIAALAKLLPLKVDVLRDRTFVDVDASLIVPGDIISLDAGDRIPADCRFIEAYALHVDNATLTGESIPVARNTQVCTSDDVLHCTNLALAGTTVAAGNARAIVYATAMQSEFGKIANLAQSTDSSAFPLQRELEYLSRVVAVLATVMGITFFGAGKLLGLTVWQSLLFGIGLIVANVPEGLLPTVTLALAMGAQRMARRQVLNRHEANGIEVLTWYSHRWAMEQTNQESKSHLGFEEPQGWTRRAVERTAPMAMLLYSLIVLWFTSEGHRDYQPPFRPWYRNKRGPCFVDMLATLRRLSLRQQVSSWGLHGVGSHKTLQIFEQSLTHAA
jgi:magnesium-transporting ATPase (P-type)